MIGDGRRTKDVEEDGMQQTDERDDDGTGDAQRGDSTTPEAVEIGELSSGGRSWTLSGRALRLILWLAGRQQCINAVASERGQLWITWKGGGPNSIDGEVKTRLSGE